ncbi:MAG: UDP-N-acetylmuramate--L-alanine ligase [Clostridia bacterium]|nr:UDP-N-acetylmuramate--L-alanine ligase [Clostridia bacterium]
MAIEHTFYPTDEIDAVMQKAGRVFFIGIGGVSMRVLAEWTKRLGYSVFGSDHIGGSLAFCERVFSEHRAENIDGADVIVFTVAIGGDNPEYAAAKERGIPLFSRANYLAWLMKPYRTRITVAGTHGKSTTTAMIGEILYRQGLSPLVICGAEMTTFGSAAYFGNGSIAVVEACEYKDAFLALEPTVALALNMELDHTDYFKSEAQLSDSFARYADKAELCVYNREDEGLKSIVKGKTLSFGDRDQGADYFAKNVTETANGLCFTLYRRGERITDGYLSQNGRYNLQNALAAIAACHAIGVPPRDAASALAEFRGVSRRMEYKGRMGGILFYDDYAHHPSEIRASLRAARIRTGGHLICLFQSHTYTRTQHFEKEFAAALSLADSVALLPIFAAREREAEGADLALAAAVGAPLLQDASSAASWILETARAGDTVIVMGAGNVNSVFSYLPLE